MKPILFPKDAITFTTNGLGSLDPVSCIVTEERNGMYELECVVTNTSSHFSDIENCAIIAVIPSDGSNLQAFRIYKISEAINGLVTINARHISYDLSYNTVLPFEDDGVEASLIWLKNYEVETSKFTYWTDKSTDGHFKVAVPSTVRSCLGGSEGSILDVFGGEYLWDNFTVKLYNHRGSDTSVTLRYGKNITDINQENNLEDVITGVLPYWTDGENTVNALTAVYSSYASLYPFKRTVPLDLSREFESSPTFAQLRTAAEAWVSDNNIGLPKINIKVSFVPLWMTEEYKDIAPLERVKLCDTVGVEFEKYGISTRAMVIKTVWDVLAERYESIELGDARSTFSSTIHGIEEETKQEVADATTALENAITTATETISGNKGGYVVFRTTDQGKPYEILIMDTDNVNTANKVWRFNQSGWGYSSTGINGPYTLAATQNGEIVADFITTGTLNANLIKVGTLSDTGGNITINMSTGQIQAKKLSVQSTNFTLAENGHLEVTGADINGEFRTRFPVASGAGVHINADTIEQKALNSLGTEVTSWSISPIYNIDGSINTIEIVTNNEFTFNGYTGFTGMLGSHYVYKGFVTNQ